MKRQIESLTGFTIGGTDGEVGKVKDFTLMIRVGQSGI